MEEFLTLKTTNMKNSYLHILQSNIDFVHSENFIEERYPVPVA